MRPPRVAPGASIQDTQHRACLPEHLHPVHPHSVPPLTSSAHILFYHVSILSQKADTAVSGLA